MTIEYTRLAAAVSMSVATSVICLAVSSLVETLLFCATGASFTGVTVMLTVATLLSSVPSFVLNVKLSGPL